MPNTLKGLDRLDLSLISTLIVLLEEQSTTLAAQRLHLAQSTVSGTLSRLRDVFDDDLLVRQGRKLKITTRGEEILNAAKPHFDALLESLNEIRSFDPNSDDRVFRIGCTDAVGFSILPKLVKLMHDHAPNCKLSVRIGDYRTLPNMLLTGEISVAVGYFRDVSSVTSKSKVLHHAPWVVLRDRSTLEISNIEEFCRRPHALVTPLGDLKGFVDEQLSAIGQSRKVTVGLSSFSMILGTLPGTDLVTTVPDFVAERLAQIAGFVIDPCPVTVPPVTNSMVWPAANDRDPAQKWLRSSLVQVFTN